MLVYNVTVLFRRPTRIETAQRAGALNCIITIITIIITPKESFRSMAQKAKELADCKETVQLHIHVQSSNGLCLSFIIFNPVNTRNDILCGAKPREEILIFGRSFSNFPYRSITLKLTNAKLSSSSETALSTDRY